MDKFRFGRRTALPSTAQIKHELRLMQLADRIAALRVKEAGNLTGAGSSPPVARGTLANVV